MSSPSFQAVCNHILMVEPVEFFANPETMDTNVYQHAQVTLSHEEIFRKALAEFRAFRDLLVENDVMVTTVTGTKGSPDSVFPNWASTHRDGRMMLYPMMSENRRAERDVAVIEMLSKSYPLITDWSAFEDEGLYLEARGSIVSDRQNKRAYAGLSGRTSRELAEKWAEHMGYEIEIFDTLSHTGKPVYHTDLVIWIGSTLAGICSEAIVESDRDRIVNALKQTHEVIEFDNTQLQSFCGNALEVMNKKGERFLALSEAAYKALKPEQKALMEKQFDKLLYAPLDTLEAFGGGSARCCLMELY